jgi:hypothetical protein
MISMQSKLAMLPEQTASSAIKKRFLKAHMNPAMIEAEDTLDTNQRLLNAIMTDLVFDEEDENV